MDFKESINDLSKCIKLRKDNLRNEEDTKRALILPFINALGYDVFNTLEVASEMICDVEIKGIKKGERVDYCIINNGKPIILIECKHCMIGDLSSHFNQLYRYYSTSKAKFGVLTNGIIYQFYSDLEEINKMDSKPFLEIDLTNIEDWQIDEIQKFHKAVFDAERIRNAARKRKDTEELATKLKNTIKNELHSPSEDLVNFFIEKVCGKELSQELFVYFSEVVKQHFVDLIADKSNVATTHPHYDIGTNRHRTTTSSGKDKSQYAINGKGCYGKCPLPKEVVKEYLKQYNILSIEQLQDIFLDDLQGSRLGVIRAKIEDKNAKRYYKIEDHKLGIIYVCKDWYPWTITNFISHVNTHIEGITITKIE